MASYNDYSSSSSNSSSGNGSGAWNYNYNNHGRYGNYNEDATPKYPDVQNNQEWLEVVPNQSPLYPVPVYEPVYTAQGEVHTPGGIQTSGELAAPTTATAEAAERGEGKSPGGDSSWESDAPATGREAKSTDSRRRVLGLTVPVFWALVIAAVIILAAGIGGGIGGGLVAQQQKSNSLGASNPTATPTTPSEGGSSSSSSSSPSSSSSSTATVALPTDGGCPQIEGQTYTPYAVNGQPIPLADDGRAGQLFRQQCYTNWVSSAASGTHDILRIYMPTLENCMMTCAEYNAAYRAGLASGAGVGGGYCVAVSIVKQSAGFCYLKNGTVTNDTLGTPEAYSSAVLITDTST
ncbi:hypothetical protein F4809DRAFT_663560 [Biscogniauxia mediterranea]|nr:hypothetical protein F4809DRAFT_663560 [Biscogniauxia mediterranea]